MERHEGSADMKRNNYQWSFEGICPVNRRSDKYFATIEVVNGFVQVEDLLEFCEKAGDVPMFQEEWAKLLHKKFGGKVTLIGHHKGGVRIESVVDGEEQ